MASQKWNSYPHLTAGELADDDKLAVSDESQTTGEKDATTTIGALKEAVAASIDTPYDLLLGFVGTPDSSAMDWLLIGRDAVIDSGYPGEAHARTNPADGSWVAALLVNGSSVGTVEISTTGAVTWNVSLNIDLSPGDRIELQAPSTADSAAADIQVLLRGVIA